MAVAFGPDLVLAAALFAQTADRQCPSRPDRADLRSQLGAYAIGKTGQADATGPPRRGLDQGIRTLSMTWMTPFEAAMSAVVTVDLSTLTPDRPSMCTVLPCTVATSIRLPAN
jgi:hypothetical protein